MAKKKTHEQFIAEVFEKVGTEYTVMGQYITTDKPVLFKHNECGLEFTKPPFKFLGGRRCKVCKQKERTKEQTMTHEEFVMKVFEKVGDEFTVLGEYIGSKEKIGFKHNKCGRVFKMQPSNFLFGQRCKTCSHKELIDKQRHTTEMFIDYVSRITEDNEYTVLGEYINNHTNISMRHNDCGFEYTVYPSDFKGGQRCPKCNNKIRRTPQMYRDDVYELVGDEYTVLGDFNITNEGILTRHNKCGYEWDTTTPSAFIGGVRCPKCAGNMLKTHEEFVEKVFELVGVEYEVLSTYINSNEKVLMRHNACGDEFPVSPNKFTGKTEFTRCPRCMLIQRGESRMKTTDEFKEDLRILYGDDYTVLGEYKGSKERILVKHNPCGSEFSKAPSDIMTKNCKRCSTLSSMKTHEQFLLDVKVRVGDEYNPLEQYNGAHNKINMMHEICGHIWKTSPHKFVSGGRRCPRCNESKGEAAIRRFLESNDIAFIQEYRISRCRLSKPLPFDFGVFDATGLTMLIEFDGEQHFHPIESFGGEKALKGVQLRDKIKDKYCMDYNIELLRIPYNRLREIDDILYEALFQQRLLMDSAI
ncbi:hypothetical protein ACFX4I_12085 [Peribacillus sp. YIM B13472]|uniref:hypothetical protein n=1 Tax=Peribacillus sp. YIM B13472 TaxID=3366297 RepID=UPI00366E1D38